MVAEGPIHAAIGQMIQRRRPIVGNTSTAFGDLPRGRAGQVYPRTGPQRVAELFAEINRCEPVLHVDLPDGGAADSTSGGGEELAAALAGAAEALRGQFPDMFKESQVRGLKCTELSFSLLV
jgi:hypothetical protein